MMATVLQRSAPAMHILVFFSALVIVVFGSLLYFAEGTQFSLDASFAAAHPTGVYVRPDITGHGMEPTAVRSIPWAFWWAATTMTTVGYGDIAPTSSAGKAVGIALFYVGIILLALPITILGT